MVVAVATIALALAQQAAPGQAPVRLECSLVTPAGDSVGLAAPHWDETKDQITLAAGAGGTWPIVALTGHRGVLTGTPGARRMYAFGSEGGLALDIAEATPNQNFRVATMYRRDRLRIGLPIAIGFCRQGAAGSDAQPPQDMATDPREIAANIPAFDPARWRESDCGLILTDGRRLPFRFSLPNRDQVRLSSPELWPGGPITMAIRWGSAANSLLGTFGRRGGPNGRGVMAVAPPMAVRLIRLWEIGGSTAPGLTGFGICGYNRIVRRAN